MADGESYLILPIVPLEKLFDYDYLAENNQIEEEMIDIIKNQTYDKKQILYKIIKQFAV